MKYRDDSGGYTLQTIIVSAILLVVATTASVALYRAITTSADVRSFADLTSEANERAPTKPHNFSVRQKDGIATVKWSAPLYTGTPQLSGSPSPLDYEIEYLNPDDCYMDATVTSLPPLIGGEGEEIEVKIPLPDLDNTITCSLEVRITAIDDQQIPGEPAVETLILSRAASAPTGITVLKIGSGALISWEAPENTGSGKVGETLFYKVEIGNNLGENNEIPVQAPYPVCTFDDNYEADSIAENNSMRITSYVYISNMGLDLSAPMCPQELDDPYSEMNTYQIIVIPSDISTETTLPTETVDTTVPTDTPPPETESSVIVFLPKSDVLGPPDRPENVRISTEPSSDLRNPIVLLRRGVSTDVVVAKLEWDHADTARRYFLEWSRADGLGASNFREIDSPTTVDQPSIFFSLENGVGYNFVLWAENSFGEGEQFQNCTAVSTNVRPIKPEVEVSATNDTELLVRITTPTYADSCIPKSYCFSNLQACVPASPSHYRIRINKTTVSCPENGPTFPTKSCSPNDSICIMNRPNDIGITERILDALSPNTDYIIEVIASSINLCSTEFNPNDINFGATKFSLPTFVRATTLNS